MKSVKEGMSRTLIFKSTKLATKLIHILKLKLRLQNNKNRHWKAHETAFGCTSIAGTFASEKGHEG